MASPLCNCGKAIWSQILVTYVGFLPPYRYMHINFKQRWYHVHVFCIVDFSISAISSSALGASNKTRHAWRSWHLNTSFSPLHLKSKESEEPVLQSHQTVLWETEAVDAEGDADANAAVVAVAVSALESGICRIGDAGEYGIGGAWLLVFVLYESLELLFVGLLI